MRGSETRRPERLGDVLQGLLRSRGFPRQKRSSQIQDTWSAVAGEDAARTTVSGYRSGVVEIQVESAALHQELSCFRKQELLERLRAELPNAGIQDIVFRQT